MTSQLKVDRISPATGSEIIIDGFGGGAGSIIQTVLGTDSVHSSINTTDYVETGLEATITPTKASSKILVTFNIAVGWNGNNGCGLALERNGQIVWGGWYRSHSYIYVKQADSVGANVVRLYQGPFIFMDEPNTTGPLTYKSLAAISYTPAGAILINGVGPEEAYKTESQILLQEIAG